MIKNLRKNRKGFTLVEIIVVVVILAVLMAVAVPSVLRYVNEADDAKYMAQARGAFIVAQTESAKEYIKDSTITKWEADKDNHADALTGLTNAPAVTKIEATIANGVITKVDVTFGTEATATIEPNGQVTVTKS